MNSLYRKNTVNLKRYLPDFLFSDSDFNSTTAAHALEHEKIRRLLMDVFDQFYVVKSTWALKYYEELLEITPAANDTNAQRRNAILLKLQSHQTSTVEYMAKLVARYCAPGAAVEIEEQNSKSAFSISFSTCPFDFPGLIKALETYKPAHLTYFLIHLITANIKKLYAGAYIQHSKTTTYAPANNFNAPDLNKNMYFACVISIYKCNKIGGNK